MKVAHQSADQLILVAHTRMEPLLAVGTLALLIALFFGEWQLSIFLGTCLTLGTAYHWQRPTRMLLFERNEGRVVLAERWRWIATRVIAEVALDDVEAFRVAETADPEDGHTLYWLTVVMKDGLQPPIPNQRLAAERQSDVIAAVNRWLNEGPT